MKTYAYPASATEIEPGEFEIRFRDLPEILTFGASLGEALLNASDALDVAIEHYLNLERDVPAPSEHARGEHLVLVPINAAVRLALFEAMEAQNLTKAGLAGAMGKDEKVARRILSGKGASLDQAILALRSIGVPVGLTA